MKKTLKIAAAAAALLLIAGLLYFVFSFYGNPVSKFLAGNGADTYVKKTYPQLSLQRKESVFSFKTGEYEVRYVSDKSADTHFSVFTGGWGEVKRDDYEWRVTQRWNTLDRLNKEYKEIIDPIFWKISTDYQMVLALYGGKTQPDIAHLPLDMQYDHRSNKLPGEVSVYVYTSPADMNWNVVAKRLKQADEALDKEGIRPAFYTYVLVPVINKEKPGADPARLGVHNLPRQTLETGGDLAAALEAHAKAWEAQMGAQKDKEMQAAASK